MRVLTGNSSGSAQNQLINLLLLLETGSKIGARKRFASWARSWAKAVPTRFRRSTWSCQKASGNRRLLDSLP